MVLRFSALLSATACVVGVAVATSGCFGSKLASPFDQMASSSSTVVTVLRLQNFEPQPAAPTMPGAAGAVQVPPQIQQWLQAGAQLLPPGLLPPNLVPGAQAAPVASTVPRFHNFPILATAQVTNPKTREEIFAILGSESSFVPQTANCMYAEFGIAIQQMNAPPAEILVSLSCSQVQAFNTAWPYTKNGVSPDTAKRIVTVMQRSFGG